MNYYRSVKKLSENASSKGQNQKFPTQGNGIPLSLDHFPRSLGPCHLPSKLLLLLILTEKQLKRFKKQKSPTQGKGTPLPLDHNPLQPWPFGSLHMPSTLLMFLILTFYTEHCMVSITTKALKSGLKMRLARCINQKFSYPGKGDIPSFGSPSYTATVLCS